MRRLTYKYRQEMGCIIHFLFLLTEEGEERQAATSLEYNLLLLLNTTFFI